MVKNNKVQLDTNNDENRKYKVEAIWNEIVYANKPKSSHLPDFYYLVLWKKDLKKENA